MFLNTIIKQVNKLLSNSSSYQLSYKDLEFYLERTVDHINQILLTDFETPKEYFENRMLYYNMYKIINTNDDYYFIGEVSTKYNNDNVYYNNTNEVLMIGDNIAEPNLIEEGCTMFYYIPDDDIFISWDGTEYKKHSIIDLNLDGVSLCEDLQSLGSEYFNYTEMPDRYIRSCVIYYASALYLEEEDEFEQQYNTYRDKAEEELSIWRKQYFSCYDARW